MNILVLGGGASSEREVSLRSAAAVLQALTELGHAVVSVDPRDGDEAVKTVARECDAVFPILHGAGGEDGTIQRVLDEVGAKYLGSGAAASALCFDKGRLKELLRAHDILTPASEVVTEASFWQSSLIKHPFVLKPVADGSSVGALITRTLPFDETATSELLARYGEMLLEEFVDGVEITVPVLGEEALPVIEIVPPRGGEFDYENKYNGATAELCPPRHVEEATQEQAQRLAERVHELAGCRHLSRTDMIVAGDGRIVVLEINTMPGLTTQSLYPKSAAVAGLEWTDLVSCLVDLAVAGE